MALDLGFSSLQMDDPAYGLSFQAEGPLDMRLSGSGETAADFLNTASEGEIADVLFHYGEEPAARRIARAIVKARPLTRTAQLADEVGIPAVIATAHRMGVTAELPNVPSLALGSAEVTLLEMTRAYAGVLAGAAPVDTHSVHAIRGAQPQPLYLRPSDARLPA